jgi:hypothetical protein
MFFEEVSSWNLRDSHMVETLEALVVHLVGRTGPRKSSSGHIFAPGGRAGNRDGAARRAQRRPAGA